ncbi:40S ribosomal protein S27-like [Arvicola amphibius]|uniref:40S ribosomal protein S27-like n=1 Tax=Arvicola amphibius TaxID=1047088 RepID=UPI001C09D870|nr:40S ribosomal protein S27-like [Arvicola amphibius]
MRSGSWFQVSLEGSAIWVDLPQAPKGRQGWRRAECPGLSIRGQIQHPGIEYPSPEEKRKHKKKHLVQSPNFSFMDVKCPGCYNIAMVFSRAQMVVLCFGCSVDLCQPTGGKTQLTEGCPFRGKQTEST